MVKIRKLSFWEGEKMDKERLEQLNNKFNAIRANGGIMPQAQGDDYNNDIINLVPSRSVKTFEIGRDEQDNPIMSSDAATALGKPAEQETGKNWLDNINNAISKPTPAEDLRKYEALLDQEGELTSFTTPSIDLSEEGFKDWLKDTEQLAKGIADSMDSFKASRLYANLFYGKDALQERIHKISKATGIGESVLASNDDVYQHGEKLLQQLEKYEKIPSMLTTDGKLDMQKVYQEMPYLKILQEKHGDVTAAMAMANAKGLMTINDVYKNEFERFAASVGFGLDKGWNNLRRQYTYGKAMLRGLTGSDGRLTVDEKSYIDQLNKENAERPDYSYSGIGSGLGAMIGGAAENLPMILSSQGIAKVSGVTAGFVAKRLGASNAMAYKVYNWVSNAVGVGVMGLEIGGGQYEENLYKLDKNGNLMYTPRQAAAISLLQGVSEGVLEQYSLNQIGRAVFGGKELIPIAELWKKAPELAATEGMKTAEEATRRFIADKIADAAKRNLIIFRSELQEEFTQQVSDMVIENMAQVVLKGDQAELSSAGEILTKSLGAAMVAVPSILGFSFIGGVGLHPIANAKSVLGARQRIAQLMTNDLARAVHENTHQINTIDGVARNLDNIAELNQKAPEVQRDILDDMNRRFGMETTDVDIKTLNQQEGGEAVVNAIAEKAGITADELQACAQGTGMLRVKTSVIQETVHDIQDNEPMVTELYRNLAKDETVLTSHKAEEAQKRSREIIKKMQDIAKKTHEQEINTIVAKDFNQNEAEAREARSILEANYDNAEKEYKRRLNDVNSRIMDIIGPVLKELKSGMRQGVDIVRVESERDAHYEKVSNNDEWARNYYEDYGHWPNERELVDLAIDIAAGRQNPRYGLMDYQNNTEESRQHFEAQAAALDELVERRDLLEGMKDRFEGMKAGDRAAQAMLSPEGMEVYELAKKEFAASQNKEVRAAAKEQALAYARYCDLMAQNYAEVYNKPFTAKDYMNEILHVNVNAVEGKAPMQNAAQLNQASDNKKILDTLRNNVKDWVKIESEEEGLELLEKVGNPKTKLENDELDDGAHLSKGKIEEIVREIKKNKRQWIPEWELKDYYEIIINSKVLLPKAKLEKTKKPGPTDTSSNNEKTFNFEENALTVKFYARETKNQRKNKNAVGDTIFKIEVSNKKSTPQVAGVADEVGLRQRWNALSDNSISEKVLADKSDLKKKEKLSLEDIKNSYIHKFVSGPIDALSNIGEVSFKRYDLIDEFSDILEQEGAKRKGQISFYHSSYYVIDGNLIRIADHESTQPESKQDWVAEFILNDDTIIDLLGDIKTREELKQFIKSSIAEQVAKKRKITLNQSALDKYYQQQGDVKGSTSFSETSPLKIVSLFQTADRSTFMHEMSHVYLLDLERLAAAAPDSRFAKDYATVMAWASWKKGMAEEYKGTASYEEFKKREQNILEAQIKGDTETEEKLLNEWAQERFARGFEEYLRKGEAPAVGLQNAFRNFKRWLTKIYKSFIGAGVRATPEVEAVMGRMLASEEEIQVMDEIMEGNRLAGLDGLDMMPTDVAAMYSRWQEKAHTQAEEQLLKELLKDYKKNVQDRLKEHEKALREEITARLQQDEPCYAVDEAVADGTDLNSALFMFNLTSREYEKRKKELGGDLEKAVEKQVKKEMEEFRRQMPDDKMLHDQAMQALYSGDYQTRLAELERKILRAYKDRYMEAPQMLQKGLHELDNAREKAKPELMKRKLAELKYSIRWNDDQWNIVKEMEDLLALETGDTVSAEKLDAFDRKYNELKASTVQNKDWLRKVRGGTMEQVEAWKRAARFRLEEMNLRDAMNYEHWIREGEKQAAVAGQEFSKAQKNKGKEGAKHAEKAEQAKQRQAAFVAMTAESIAMKKKVGQWIGRIRNRQKSMAAGKEKMDPNLRYFHDHILWVYGLAAADARKPVTLGKKQFMDVMRDLMTEELQLSEEQLPAWLVKAADDVEQDSKGYNGLTMSDFQDLMNFTTWLYTLSKNQQKLLTMDVSLEQVEGDCFKDWSETIYLSRQTASDVKKQLGRYMAMIVKPETWLNVLGGKEGAFIRYIYMPLLKAAEAEEIAQEKEAKFLRGYDVKKEDGTVEHVKGLFERFYTKEELRHIANDKLFFENGEAVELHYPGEADYLSIRDVTKENILCMALNWGNRTNRSRLCKSLGIEDEEFFQHQYLEPFMTANDWAFVQAMWDHINEFADPASEVLEKATGIPMKRVEADAFSVKTEDGEVAMKGGYYPIVKDVDRSMREVEFEKMEQAQSMGGASVFGVGMGSTKERSASREISDPLLLELRVASSHIKGMIHIINSRLAVRDAYKVLHNKQIQAMIMNTLNQDAYKAMDEWVLANWHAPIQPTDIIIEKIAKVRSRTVGAIMAYRVSTALLNAANFVYIAQEIGWINMGRAVFDYYKDWKENAEFVRNASVYMRNRDTNMDRDLNTQADELMKHHGRLMNKLNDVTGERADELSYFVGKYANWLIEKTDAALSKPLYLWQYKQTYNAAMQEGKSAQEAGEAANLTAVRTVTHVFSSSRKVDSSAVQRSRSELVKMLTPFFSFSNMMMNAVWSKWYEGKYQGRKVEVLDEDGNVKHNEDGSVMYTTVDRSFRERYAGFAWAAIQNYMIGALVETMIREAINSFTGSGDDDDYLTRVLKKYPKNVIDSAIGGFAGINVLVDPVAEFWLNYLIEGKIYYQFSSSGGRSSAGVLGGAAKRFYNVFVEDAGKLLKGSQKFDTLDLMRDVVKLGNSVSGFSDTLTDALFNTARFAVDDYRLNNMDDLREYIAKSLFDRKLKKR